MASGKITKRTIDALIVSRSEGFLWDDGIKGFGAKITKSGAVSYILQFRMGGREARTRRCTIGSHGSPWTPTTAREEALRLSRLIGQGVDPVEVEKQRRREAVDLAFDNYAERFEKACVGRGWKLLVARSLRIHSMPVLKSKPLTKITRPDIVAVFDRMFLAQVFDEELNGETAYYFSEEGASDLISLPSADVRAALDAATPETSRIAQKLIDEQPDAILGDDDIELDMCGDLWPDVLQDIVRRSLDLDHLTVTMAFTCSKMRPDGFGGLAMLITAATIRSESTHTLFDRFYKEANANGEISHGNS